MSFLLNFAGGMAESGAGILRKQMEREALQEDRQTERQNRLGDAKDLAEFNRKLDMEKAETLETLKAKFAEQGRTARVERVGEAVKGVIKSRLDEQYADPVAGDTPLTPEQEAAQKQGLEMVAREKEAKSAAMARDPNVIMEAEMQTGDLAGKEYATFKNQERAATAAARRADIDEIVKIGRMEADSKKADAALLRAEAAIAAQNAMYSRATKTGDKDAAEQAKLNLNTAFANAERAMKDMVETGQIRINNKTGAITGPDSAVAKYEGLQEMATLAQKSVTQNLRGNLPEEKPAPKPTGSGDNKTPTRLRFDPATNKLVPVK